MALVDYEIAPRRRGVTTIIRLIAPIASGPDRHITITTATIIQITISPTENIYISITYKAHTTLLDKSDQQLIDCTKGIHKGTLAISRHYE